MSQTVPVRIFLTAWRVLSLANVSNFFSAVSPLHAALDYHMVRHNILVSNVAHADTPNYVPRDLVQPVSFEGALELAVAQTSANHLNASGPTPGLLTELVEDRSAGEKLDGNYVSLDREASKIAANQSRYDVVATLISAELRALSFAANDGAGGA